MEHPHPDKHHVVVSVRQFILGCKRRFGTARSQVHYRELLQTYLTAKRRARAERKEAGRE